MDRETAVIPLAETPAPPRAPMHLRYLALLRTNPSFRLLWGAQLISEIGDWFYSLAVYDMLLNLTGSGKAVAYAIILQLLPWFLMMPLAGYLADRFSRRRLMILADIVRGAVVLGLLLVRSPGDVWLIYVLLALEVSFASIFEPARNAYLPNLVSRKDLLPANALAAATWSVALTVGAALGGAVTTLLGREVSFVVNSFSFLLSAALLRRIRVEEAHVGRRSPEQIAAAHPGRFEDLREGAAYLAAHPRVAVLVLAKTGLGLMGGMMLLLAVFGERIFPIGGHGALAMGLLYSARGVGAGLGPLVGDQWTRGDERRMWRTLSFSFFVMSLSYVAFSYAPNLALAALAVLMAHMGGSLIWVMSTALLQMNVADRYRGRVFAVDFGVHMAVAASSNYLVGAGLDDWKFTPRELAGALGGALMLPAFFWAYAERRWAIMNSVNN
jgi:MFS family permease